MFLWKRPEKMLRSKLSHTFCFYPFLLLSFSRFFSLLHWVLSNCCVLTFADLFKLFCALMDGEREELVCVALRNDPFLQSALQWWLMEVCGKHRVYTGRDRCQDKLHRKKNVYTGRDKATTLNSYVLVRQQVLGVHQEKNLASVYCRLIWWCAPHSV